MTQKQVIIHMATTCLKHIADLQRQLSALDKSKDGDPILKKTEMIRLSTETVRFLHMIEPALPFVLKELPEFNLWFDSIQGALIRIKQDGAIEGNICQCKGCKGEE